jgi:hypothetical protein
MPFPSEIQQHRLWCWAAVSASIRTFLDVQPQLTQCEVAGKVLSKECCGPGADCNQTFSLSAALEKLGLKRLAVGGQLPFGEIAAEIERGYPVGVRIGWSLNSGHFVLITGCRRVAGSEMVAVSDPFYGESVWRYKDFCAAYQRHGVWTHTYLVRAYTGEDSNE